MDLTELNLDTIAGRKAPKVFEHLLKKVLANIDDPNTKAEAVRSITLTFKFKPSESRNEAAVKLESKVSLAAVEPHTGFMFMRHVGGETIAATHDVAQEDLFDESDEEEEGNEVVDERTGEIIGSIGNNK